MMVMVMAIYDNCGCAVDDHENEEEEEEDYLEDPNGSLHPVIVISRFDHIPPEACLFILAHFPQPMVVLSQVFIGLVD